MNNSKEEYKNNKKKNKYNRKQQQNMKSFKNTSLENQDIPEGMYNTKMEPTIDEISYIYHEKEEKNYSSDCSDLFDKKETITNNENEQNLEETTFNDDYFTPITYTKKSNK